MDTLKPSMLDPIDVELLKPSANMAAEAYCATVVSNIEGWKGATLPRTKESRRATIDQLDTRVRRLESMDGINPPPPMDTPSWDSLTWRIARLHRKMPPGPVGALNALRATPPHITPTTALLQSTVTSIGGIGPQSWAVFVEKEEEDLEGDDLLHAAAQFLCYLAGRRSYKVVGSFELKQNCVLALDLSLDADAKSGFYVGPAFPAMGPKRQAMPRPAPVPFSKACCGCCGCSCHNANSATVAPKPSVLRWMTGKYHEEKRASRTGVKARIAGAFRKLAFWRRHSGHETDSDVSSITTRSSSTFA
ncbi:hypothetical protein HD806DRAFT_517924 [Xylariaceae sp. AK1471]|nr:hypothetical protein HD806DRAFT_517924 [Xylariaceae sp. AK1471]